MSATNTTASQTQKPSGAAVRQAVSQVALAGYQVSREVATLLTNAFGLVAALAWSDALKGAFARIQAFKTWPVIGPFLLAAVITLGAYFASVLTSRIVKPQCTRLCAAGDSSKSA